MYFVSFASLRFSLTMLTARNQYSVLQVSNEEWWVICKKGKERFYPDGSVRSDYLFGKVPCFKRLKHDKHVGRYCNMRFWVRYGMHKHRMWNPFRQHH